MLDFLAHEPNWIIVSLIGAILGAIVTKFGTIIAYPFRSTMPIEGTWFVYHYTFQEGALVLLEDTMIITKATLRGLEVRISPSIATDDVRGYRGTATHESSHLLIHARGEASNNNGSLSIRLQPRIPPNDRIMFGLWLSYDHDLHPACGIAMINRHQMGLREAGDVIQGWFEVRRGAIHLLSHPRPRRHP